MKGTEYSTEWSRKDIDAQLWTALLKARQGPPLSPEEAKAAAQRFLEAERRMIEADAIMRHRHRVPFKEDDTADALFREAVLERDECRREAVMAGLTDGVRVQAFVESLCPAWCDHHERQHDHFGPDAGLREWCQEVLDPFMFHTRTFGDPTGACITAHFRVGLDGSVTQRATCVNLETCDAPEDLEAVSVWFLEAAAFIRDVHAAEVSV